MQKESNENLLALKIIFYPIIGLLVLALIIAKVFHLPLFDSNAPIVVTTWSQDTGTQITWWIKPIIVEGTWSIISWEIQTGEIIKSWNVMPDEPRWIVDYIMKNWTLNTDYIYADLYPQPVTHWKTSTENNAVYFKYIYKYRYPFAIPTDKKSGYIFITLNKPLAKDRDIFLAINWSSIWPLIKAQSENVRNETEYLYPMNKIPARWLKWLYSVNLFERIKNWILTLGWFVSESWNWIKNITIVLK